MRIITGIAKGARLKTPRGMDVRPTADRVKESVFNILGQANIESDVLDLFSGTGNLGLEAVSRGAKSAVLVDQSPSSIELIKANAIHTKLIDRVKITRSEVLRYLDRANNSDLKFDLIFCDPPYNQGLVDAVLLKVNSYSLLKPRGIMVVEHSRRELVNDQYDRLRVVRSEKYGETMVTFITPIGEEDLEV